MADNTRNMSELTANLQEQLKTKDSHIVDLTKKVKDLNQTIV